MLNSNMILYTFHFHNSDIYVAVSGEST